MPSLIDVTEFGRESFSRVTFVYPSDMFYSSFSMNNKTVRLSWLVTMLLYSFQLTKAWFFAFYWD
jgi:hypothetical protein